MLNSQFFRKWWGSSSVSLDIPLSQTWVLNISDSTSRLSLWNNNLQSKDNCRARASLAQLQILSYKVKATKGKGLKF